MNTRLFLALALALPVATGCATTQDAKSPVEVAQNDALDGAVEREMTEEERIEAFTLPDPMMAAPGQMEVSWEPKEEVEEKKARPRKADRPYTFSDKKRPSLFVLPTKYEE